MPDDAADRLFAEQYVTARQKFLDQAERMDLKVRSIAITEKGPQEENLSTDFVWIGNHEASKLILHLSLIHI